jgi:hypothetical protein
MTTPSTSVLTALGYQVLSLEHGIYVLHPVGEPAARIVALLLAAHPARASMLPVQLYLQPVPAPVPAVDIIEVWADLDARRFEQTGLEAVAFELGPLVLDAISLSSFERPNGGLRRAMRLPSGDVVCLN